MWGLQWEDGEELPPELCERPVSERSPWWILAQVDTVVDSLDAGMSSAQAGARLGLSVVCSSEEVETEHTELEILLRMGEMDSRWPWVLPQLKLRCLFFPCPLTYLFPWSIVVFSFQCACLCGCTILSRPPLVVPISLPAFFFSVPNGSFPSHYLISRPGEQTFYEPS